MKINNQNSGQRLMGEKNLNIFNLKINLVHSDFIGNLSMNLIHSNIFFQF